jgi:hypothetical protein
MNCPECSNPIEKGAQFCPKCYARIEPPGLWRRFLSLFENQGKPRRSVITFKKTVNIKTVGKDGERHEYHSLEELPPQLRAEIEKLESDAEKEVLGGDPSTRKIITTKTSSVIRVKDASGKETTYHSLEELPPDIRAALEKARGKTD